MFPENTMSAFIQAVKDGADIIETDLHLSGDDRFICIHDPTTDRTMNASRVVSEMTYNKLKELHALGKNGQPTDEGIPVLEEIADFLPKNVALALELKSDRFLDKKVNKRLYEILKSFKINNRTIAISFSLERLLSLKKELPETPIGWISMSRIIPDKQVDLIGAFWPLFYINPWYVHMAHKRGLFTCPLDPVPDSRLGYYLRLGVDAVLSDHPGRTRKQIEKLDHSNVKTGEWNGDSTSS